MSAGGAGDNGGRSNYPISSFRAGGNPAPSPEFVAGGRPRADFVANAPPHFNSTRNERERNYISPRVLILIGVAGIVFSSFCGGYISGYIMGYEKGKDAKMKTPAVKESRPYIEANPPAVRDKVASGLEKINDSQKVTEELEKLRRRSMYIDGMTWIFN